MALTVPIEREESVGALAQELLEVMKQRDTHIARARDRTHKEVMAVMSRMRESIKRETLVDPGKIDWDHPRLSMRSLRRSVYEAYRTRRLREAVAETAFGQLLRYGVQHYLFDAYQSIATVMEAVYEQRPSSNRQEWYAPLYGAEVPEDVEAGGRFSDSRIRGLDVMVVNKKVGRMLSVERELVDDDQTGQIVTRATRLGERMRYKEELDAVTALVNAKDFSTGVAATGYTTAIGNKGTAGVISQPLLEAAAIALRKMKDPLDNFMLVDPDTVLGGPDVEIPLYKLLNSIYQPSIPGTAPETASTAVSGQVGWTLTANWLRGRYTPVISTFFAHPTIAGSDYWFVLQAKRGAVVQNRDPLEVVQENPLSGQAFEYDSYRYRVRRRYKHAVIEPRFIFQGKGAA